MVDQVRALDALGHRVPEVRVEDEAQVALTALGRDRGQLRALALVPGGGPGLA